MKQIKFSKKLIQTIGNLSIISLFKSILKSSISFVVIFIPFINFGFAKNSDIR